MRVKGWGWWALLCAGRASAQAPAPLQDPGQHSVRVVRTTGAPPVIDGKLDEAAWRTAALVDNLHQTTPIEYAMPDERTEIFLMYDDEALYIAARLYDPEPDKITANNLRQADNVGQDDRFYVTLDPFNEPARGYFFGLNPNGVRADGLYHERHRLLWRVGQHLLRRGRAFRRRLDRRDVDSVQVDLVRSDAPTLGA